MFAYVGNFGFTPDLSGIEIYDYDVKTGKLEWIKKVLEEICAGHAVIDEERDLIYITDERRGNPQYMHGQAGGGQVYVLKVDRETGDLEVVQKVMTFASAPAYIAMDDEKKFMIVVHFAQGAPVSRSYQDENGEYHLKLVYDEATTVLFEMNEDGTIGKIRDIKAHEPEGPAPLGNAHVHSVHKSPFGNLYAICDMGLDRIYMYAIDYENKKLVVKDIYEAPAGYGPRYGEFHPTKKFYFCNYEVNAHISAFKYDDEGKFTEICTLDLQPEDPNLKKAKPSGLSLSHDGKFIYTILRECDCIQVYSVDQETGMLTNIQTEFFEGRAPRICEISPDGRFLLVGNKGMGQVLVYAIGEDGKITLAHEPVKAASPGTINFFGK